MTDQDDLVEAEGVNAGSTEPATAAETDEHAAEMGSAKKVAAAQFGGEEPGVSGAKRSAGPGQELSAGEG